MSIENPRAVIGGNYPEAALVEVAQRVTEDLESNYGQLQGAIDELLDHARNLYQSEPEVTDENLGRYAKAIKDLRDAAKRCDAHHSSEKQPHLRAGQAVDSFFFKLWGKCVRRNKTGRPGAADILQDRVDAYQRRKVAEEQERRRAAAEESARLAREARLREEEARRKAEEAERAAKRARLPEKIAERSAAAEAAEQLAASASFKSAMAAEAAEDAHVATLAKPADIARTRTDEALITVTTEAYAEIVDETKLDIAKLWPFVPLAAKQSALRAWAKNTGHTQQMDGASIGKRQRGVVR